MSEKLTYRKASINDFLQLQQLGIASYSEFSSVLEKEHWKTMNTFLTNDESLTRLIESSTVFVCESASKIVGMIYLVPSGNPTKLFQENWSYIRFLGVHPTFRGFGIGKKLTNLCINHAKNTNEKVVALHTSEFMDSARAIYEKRGFRKNKEITYLGKIYWIYLLNLT